MAKADQGSARSLLSTHLAVTDKGGADAALWRLSLILAEIAEQGVQGKSGGAVIKENKMRHVTSEGPVLPLTEDANDAETLYRA